ncbi:MAG: flagellar filament capping protein FliD, partial [Planctomycetota bacterium]
FQGVTSSSSDSSALVASAAAGVPPGVYTFRVAQLARSSQLTSGGFATADTTAVGAGTLSLELGGGLVEVDTELDELNGGAGVTRGTFRITDAAGGTALVDTSTAVTVDDVLDAINSATGVEVSASISSDGRALVLLDGSSGAGTLTVEDVNGLDVAADLGILGSAVGNTLQGSAIRVLGSQSRLAGLQDGLGVRVGAGDDLVITRKDGVSLSVELDGVSTVQGLFDAVNNHALNADGKLSITVNATGDGFLVTDTTGGGGSLTIANGALSTAADDLGIAGSTAGSSISGSQVLAGINDILLSSLNGGGGVASGSIRIQNRAGTVTDVDLSGERTLQGVLRAINNASAGVTALLNREGNGMLLRDTSGGSGALSVSEVGGGSTAADLGLLASVTANDLSGGDLSPRYIHANARLADLNGGKGVAGGSIRVIDSNGTSFTVDLSQELTIGDVVRDIEGAATLAGSDLAVGFNSTGNGLLLTSSSGAGTLRVEEVGGGTTATDLHIAGSAPTATPGVIDGAFEETVTIAAGDTLEDVKSAIEALGIDVSATIVNDGSSVAPYRLNLVAGVSGRNARLIADASGGAALSFTRTSRARDGVLFYGESAAGGEALLVRSNTNTYRDIIEGLTVTALSEGSSPVQISVSRDEESLREDVVEMVDKFNALLDEIGSLTAFNLETDEKGILLGDSTVRGLERSLLRGLTRPIATVQNEFTLFSEVGIRVRNGRLSFDSSAFNNALAENPAAVERLFSAARPLEDRVELTDFNNGNGVHLGASGPELEIQLRDGTTIEVDITGSVYAEDVVDAINAAGAGSVTASISSTQSSFVLADLTSGSGVFRVTALNSSSAASNLGLNKSADTSGGGTITGYEIDLAGDVGVAARLTDTIEDLAGTDSSVIKRRSDGLDGLIETLNKRIEGMEERLQRREELLRRQFAQLEQVMAASQSTLARLTAQLGALQNGARR